jgi:hypothetical protein
MLGMGMGVLLVAAVTGVAMGIARKAAASVAEFREQHYTRFTGRKEE